MTRVWYCTREDVKDALDQQGTAYADRRVDRAIQSASLNAEGLLHRRFYPEIATRTRDWPNYDFAPAWRLYLAGTQELISLTTLTAGGTVIPGGSYILRRSDDLPEPPYDIIDISLSSASAFSAGVTFQQAISMYGLFGYNDVQLATGTLATSINTSVTTVDVTNSVEPGVGSLVILDSERMQVTGRSLLSTGATLTTPTLAANNNVTLVGVSDGTKFNQSEVITIDSEQMIVRDIVSNNLIVQRGWNGSVLASHSSGVTAYAPRRLTVSRAVLGTTAASHNSTITVSVQDYPSMLRSLVIAYSMNEVLQQSSGWARVSGAGDHQKEFTGRSIADYEADAVTAIGRRNRLAAV